MPIIGGRQIGVRGLGFQGAGKANPPVINSASRVSDTEIALSYTLGSNNGAPITSILVSSTPSISLTYNNADLDGNVTVTGSFAEGTSYTFDMVAVNAVGQSNKSSGSNSVIPRPVYQLLATLDTTQTWTVPSGISKVSVYTIGGGSPGTSAGLFSGGSGGRGSSAVVFQEYNVTPGQQYTVTVGGAGGTSSFGTLATAVGTGNASSNVSGAILYTGKNATQVGENIGYNTSGRSTTLLGGGGGNGGNGGFSEYNFYYGQTDSGPANAGSPGGSGGGPGGTGGAPGGSGGPGSAASNNVSRGAAGGGGGGGGFSGSRNQFRTQPGSQRGPGGVGGAGANGRVLIYGK